jgi:hypothetical protein
VTAITGPAIANSKFSTLERGKTYDSEVCPSTDHLRAVGRHDHAGFQGLTGDIN